MTDQQIMDLIQRRDERGLREIEALYGSRLIRIAEGLLSREDAEECVNDTYLALWDHVPETEVTDLFSYLVKTLRNRAKDRYRESHAMKRSAEIIELSDILSSSVPDPSANTEEDAILIASDALNRFLGKLSKQKRILFVLRFWYGKSIEEIAACSGFSAAKTAKTLSRLKDAFKKELREES